MERFPGYTVLRTEDCPEQHGTLTVLTHDVSGATVLLVENEDVNKAFGIGFGTFPSDDTGVFHILEHSVLAGSEKYPVTSPFLQLLKSSMASFLNAMTFPDKTVYPFATPNETDFKNLMDVYLNAVFCPLAMVDKSVFEQEGWHRDADGTVSGVVYNEMQGALATPDAQLQDALERAMFPDTAYGFVSGGDPESIPALTYEKYKRVYHRHYSADNCCITLYGKMDMAEKLALLDKDYLSKMPQTGTRPRLTLQDEQPGTCVELPYYTENPEPDEVQCALAWYTGAFADRERQLGVEILLDALLGTNNSPLKAALLAENLGADIDIGFDDSTLQPTLELVLRGATEESARKFAAAVRKAVDGILADVRFDARQLTLQSVSPLNCTLESDLSLAAEGEVRLLSHSKTGGGTVFAVLTFKLADDLEEGEQVGLVLTGASAAYDGVCRRSPERGYSREVRRPTGDESFALRFPNAQVDFDPAVLSYDVLLPEDQPRLEIEADYAQGESVYIGETTVEPGLRRTISVIYTDKNGNMTVYTFRVWRRTAAQTDSSLAGIWLHGLPLKGFDKRTTAYALTVGAEIESLGLTAEPSSDEATVAIDAPKTLAYGENVLRITVTAYDGSITVYTLIVVRTPPEEEESGAESVPPADSSAAAESRTEEPAGFVLWPVVTAAVVIVVGAAVLLLLRRRRAKKRTEEEYDS